MQRFAELLDSLSTAPARNAKLRLLADYLADHNNTGRGWALAALTDGIPVRLALRRLLGDLMAERIDPHLFALSRDYVGDTAETVALLWPDPGTPLKSPPTLDSIVAQIREGSPASRRMLLAGYLDSLDTRGRWALLKFLGGGLRVGVSARLAKTALAQATGQELADIEEVWHALTPPYQELFDWLEGRAQRPSAEGKAVFRPMMLAHPIEEADWPALSPAATAAEWKWDGIRIQIAATAREVRLFSRTGDDISATFPDAAIAFKGHEAVLDGELLVMHDGEVAPFNDLQQRLNRKAVTQRMMREYPAHVRLYDILLDGTEDLRALPFAQRRRRLEAWHAHHQPLSSSVSGLISFASFEELHRLWSTTRDAGIEGIMLKRTDSPYLAGRPKGHWYKWKRAPLTLDCVLMYAQRGSGKRSSYYSDYTFGVWRPGASGEPELVPVGKAYSGFTDDELRQLDRYIRANTTETFGPVRAVKPGLVLEVAFDAIQRSARHKSGVAMRFPRIARIRWDKPAAEADTLDAALKLVA